MYKRCPFIRHLPFRGGLFIRDFLIGYLAAASRLAGRGAAWSPEHRRSLAPGGPNTTYNNNNNNDNDINNNDRSGSTGARAHREGQKSDPCAGAQS